MKNRFKQVVLILLLLIIYMIICAYSYSTAITQNISSSLFRLHVIAASDSEEDQNLKYMVRNNIISYMNKIIDKATNKNDVILIANEHLDDFKKIAEQTICENGFNYDVTLDIRKLCIPYQNIWRHISSCS